MLRNSSRSSWNVHEDERYNKSRDNPTKIQDKRFTNYKYEIVVKNHQT
ncbi:hypothetical protein [Robertmurraya korlensis]|nr:hypothetical protein [Robertmurraya korlensis]